MMNRACMLGVAVVAMIGLTGCTSGSPEVALTQPSDTPTVNPTVTPIATVGPEPTLSAADRVYVFDSSVADWDDLIVGPTNPDGTSVSGCTPPAGDVLSDGIWAVYVAEWGADALEFDLVCVYGHASEIYIEAHTACTDSHPGEECQFDAIVKNDSARLRTLPISGDATFVYFDNQASWREVPLGSASDEFTVDVDPAMGSLWLLYVNGGAITQVRYYVFPG